MDYATLSNGIKIPLLGLGTMRIFGDDCTQYVKKALDTGYRLIDTAASYNNEEAIGKALKETSVKREDIMVSTKVWITDVGKEKTRKSVERSLNALGTDYLDIVLIHMCNGDYYGSWQTLQEMYKEGKIKAIGVCNFSPERIADMCLFNEIAPMINQVETNLYFQNEKLHDYMKKYNVHQEAWGPLAQEKVVDILKDPELIEIGKKYGKTPAQISLKHTMQRGITVIPRADTDEILHQNFDLFDFELTKEEMDIITAKDTGYSFKSDYGNPLAAEYAAQEYRGDADKMFD